MMISRMCIVETERLVSNGRPEDAGVINTYEAHDTAAFLPWHRYFIHVYEEALREQCSYSGHLTYVQDPELQTKWLSILPDTGTGLLTGKMSPRLLSGIPSSDSAATATKRTLNPFMDTA